MLIKDNEVLLPLGLRRLGLTRTLRGNGITWSLHTHRQWAAKGHNHQLTYFANCKSTPPSCDAKSLSPLGVFYGIDSHGEWFTPKEVAAILGRTAQFVRDLLENRCILGHALSTRGSSGRKSHQIHRSALELYLLETANFTTDEYKQRLLRLIRRMSKTQQDQLRSEI
ncbi:MAG: hypothetical protein LBC42_02905 [Puniceicoccales bacterium]|jgi:hypothetical protein|nr:hypothetical protein [Puniceicoccales bacterium]